MRSNKGAARAAVFLGALAVLTIPAGVVAAQVSARLRLLETLYVVVATAFVLGLAGLFAARRARLTASRSLSGGGGVGLARVVAWAGAYAGVTGGLGLAVYGILRWLGAD
jgi:protein-S-isoprenylcysteine O-methyltransferase Ste14